jgi:hypothetical protein
MGIMVTVLVYGQTASSAIRHTGQNLQGTDEEIDALTFIRRLREHDRLSRSNPRQQAIEHILWRKWRSERERAWQLERAEIIRVEREQLEQFERDARERVWQELEELAREQVEFERQEREQLVRERLEIQCLQRERLERERPKKE